MSPRLTFWLYIYKRIQFTPFGSYPPYFAITIIAEAYPKKDCVVSIASTKKPRIRFVWQKVCANKTVFKIFYIHLILFEALKYKHIFYVFLLLNTLGLLFLLLSLI